MFQFLPRSAGAKGLEVALSDNPAYIIENYRYYQGN